MVPNRRPRTALLAFVLCALSVAISATLAVGTASAALLEGVTGPLPKTVGVPIEEVTETLTPPVGEAVETVTRPVEEAGEAVAPATQAVAGTVAAPPVTSVKVPAVPVVPVPSASTELPPGGAVESTGTTVREATGVATRTAQEAVGVVTGGILSDPSSAASGGPVAGPDRTGAASVQPSESERPSPVAGEPDLGPGEDTFEVPSNDGSVRAPFDRWLAYVWPAVALTGPGLANLLDHWEQHTLHLAALGTSTAGDAGSSDGPVVKGVHAAGGRPRGSDSSQSLFSRIPSALDHFPRSVPTPALAYLLVVAAMVLAVLIAIRWEIVHHRRQGQR
jgi:hypothetical protein